jgi:hypothetical protein
MYSSDTLVWPADGTIPTFDARFSLLAPDGAATPITEFFGEVFDRKGEQLPGDTVVEAYVGDLLCGAGSVQRVGSFDGCILDAAGPDSIHGCAQDAALTSASTASRRRRPPATTLAAARTTTNSTWWCSSARLRRRPTF